MDTTGKVGIVGNTLGRALERTQTIGTTELVLAYDERRLEANIDFGDLDIIISEGDLLYSAMDAVSDGISMLKADISPEYDASGTNINSNPLAVELPVIGSSLSQLVGADRLLSIGDYVQRYIGNSTDFSHLKEPVYGETGQPTMKGLLGYLQKNWLSEMGASEGALKLVTTTDGVSIAFDDTFNIESETTLRFDEAVEDYYISIDGEVTAAVAVALDVAFNIKICLLYTSDAADE